MTDLAGVSSLAAPLAAELASRAPAGVRVTTLVGHAAPGNQSWGHSVLQDPRPDKAVDPYARLGGVNDLGDGLLTVIDALRQAIPEAESTEVNVHLRVPVDQPWELVAVWEDGTELLHGGYTRTLDPVARPAVLPGWPDPPPVAPPTEPAVAEAVRPRLADYETLNPPATDAQLAAAEAAIGQSLPAELRALYAIADGGELAEDRDGLFRGWGWLSLAQLADEHPWIAQPFWTGWELGWAETHLETVPLGTVRRVTGHPGWIPFLTDHGGNFLAVDTAPGPAGQPRQVIICGRDYDSPVYAAASLTDLVRDGLAEVPDGRAFLMLRAHQVEAYGAVTSESSTPALTALVAAEPGLQELILHGLPVVDTQDLVDLDRLRALRLSSPTTRLSGLQLMAVENLRLRADRIDLGALAHHPTLRRLELTSPDLVGLAGLATCPHLVGLDLSGCPNVDVSSVGALTGLEYLRLTQNQWRQLARAGRPRSELAALTVTDPDRLWDALEIAHWFDPADRPLRASSLLLSGDPG